MQTARDFLVKANLAKPGRGKFSNDAKKHLHEAIANGQKFSDWDENGRVSVDPEEKRKFTKRADVIDAPRTNVGMPKTERYREETEIVFYNADLDRTVVLDMLDGQPVWALRKIVTPSWLEGYTWTLR